MIYCGNRWCKAAYNSNPGQCQNCGCVEFVTRPELATGGHDKATNDRLMAGWQRQKASGRAARQTAIYGGGYVYSSQKQIDRAKRRR